MRFLGKKFRFGFIAAIVLLTQVLLIGQASALAPEIEAGLQWLSSQVQSGGAVGNETSSQATPEQVRFETHETLTLLGRTAQALRDWVGLPTEASSEYLARRAVQLGLAARPDPALMAQLATRQNADGGFGGADGHASSPLDTAFALLAYG